VLADSLSGPEQTTGLELGGILTGASGRLGLDFGLYRERSSDVLVPIVSATADSAAQTGAITNTGYEVQLRAAPFHDPAGISWDLALSFSRNKNRVEKLAPGVDEIALGPALWGASLVARVGQPLGVIAGTRYLRDAATQQLLLRNGLPIPDSTAGRTLFGSWQPNSTGSLRSHLRYRSAEVAILVDARMGGKIFSATNMWGSYAGTLSSTLTGRDSGMVIVGIDSATGTTNTTKVSAEDYFHSLAAIHEPWIYNASYAKLREARVTFEQQLTWLPGFRDETGRFSIIARNLATWAKAPNIDPETALSPGVFQGFEMGQLPGTRSVGIAITITP
jgi:hypothetical protein